MSTPTSAVAKPRTGSRVPAALERTRVEPVAIPGLAPPAPSGCACGGGCTRCRSAALQRQARVSTPGDRFEREADEVAERVLRMPLPAAGAAAPPRVQRRCLACADDERPAVRRQASTDDAAALDADTATRVAGSGGTALGAELRAYFEPRFGRDLGAVRVHTGGDADRGARAVQARAYTIGTDIVFGSGEFAPHSDTGRRLLAHELTHVIQQGDAAVARAPAPASACACGGGCPRCAEARGVVQRQAAPDSETPAPAGAVRQDDSDDTSGESCGAGDIGGQVYMCCYSNAPAGDPCWKVRADTYDACYAKSARDTRAYELCLGQSNFAACRCFGPKYCHCGGLV